MLAGAITNGRRRRAMWRLASYPNQLADFHRAQCSESDVYRRASLD
jgi:hypothetical protein